MVTTVQPPGPDVSIASRFLGPTAAFLALDIILYVARMYTRLWPTGRLGMDDLTATLAMIFMVITWALTAHATSYGMGHHNYYIKSEDQMKAAHLIFAVQPLWAWSVGFAKISMACMLLRIMRSKAWRTFLFVIIAIQLISSTGFMLVVLLQCRPISAMWNPQPGAQCWSATPTQIAIYVNGAISIITDFIFTLLPFTFISKMSLPMRQKTVLGILMGMGLFATGAGIVKLTFVRTYSKGGDALYGVVDLYMWGYLEQEISIIALCVPCLKALFEKVLRRLRLVSSSGGRSSEQKSRGGYVTFGNSQKSNPFGTIKSGTYGVTSQVAHELEVMRQKGKKGDLETQSQETILQMDGQIMKTTEVIFETETLKDSERDSERL